MGGQIEQPAGPAPDRGAPEDAPTRALPREVKIRHDGTTVETAGQTTPLPGRIGKYHVKRLIGSGGMGAVYEAVQEQPRRVVALKLMKQGIASRSALRRFEYEAQLLARLRHPGIAQVYEAGTHFEPATALGGGGTVPFFAMEYIPGARPITEYARARQLSTRERLALFCKVCDAVHFGHTKGVIHRDLKPANILVESSLAVADEGTGQERIGQPKIIDFGVARATDSDLAVTTLQTDVGQLVGTLQYMSPEQAAGGGNIAGGSGADPHDIDTRSDVYALGVVLYELLCERLPYDVSRSAVFEATRVICEQAPARLSTINRTLRGDIETIALKALEKDRERRYRSAAELADDIRRYLRSEPIAARPPSVAYQVRMLARRNRPLVASGVAILLVLVGAMVGISLFAFRAERQRTVAQAHAYVASLAAAQSALLLNDVQGARAQLDAAPATAREWEWSHLRSRLDMSLAALDAGDGDINACAASPAGELVAAGAQNGIVRIWDVDRRVSVASWLAHTGPTLSVAFSPDGATVASGGGDGLIKFWSAGDGSLRATLDGKAGPVRCLAFSPDGAELVSGAGDPVIRRWNARTGEQTGVLDGHLSPVQSVGYSPDGGVIVSAAVDLTCRLWDARTGEQLVTPPFWDAGAMFASAAGRVPVRNRPARTLTAFGGNNRLIGVADVEQGKRVMSLLGHDARITAVGFSADGLVLASASSDRTVRLWDTQDWRAGVVLRGHVGPVVGCAFIPDGRTIVSASLDGTLRVWDRASMDDVPALVKYWDSIESLTFSEDGRQFASGSSERQPVVVWDSATAEAIAMMVAQVDVTAIAFAGGVIATGGGDGTLEVWDPVRQVRVHQQSAHRGAVAGIVRLVDPAGSGRTGRVLSGGEDGRCREWDLSSGTAGREVEIGSPVASMAASRDGTRVVVAGREGRVVVLDGATLRELSRSEVGGHTWGVAVSPGGDRWAVAAAGHGVRVYTAGKGEPVDESRPPSQPLSVAFVSDGRRLLVGTEDGAVLVRDPARHEDLLTLQGHREPVRVLAASPDGQTAVSGSDDHQIRVWGTVPARDRQAAARLARGREKAVRAHVEDLFGRHGAAAEVVGVLLGEKGLDPAQREAALAVARMWHADHSQANMDSWAVVKQTGRAADEYEVALRRVRVALQMMPDDGNYLNTLGVALYRLGRDEEAVGALRRSEVINAAAAADVYPGGPFPADNAFLALSLQRLGRREEAQNELARFRELARSARWEKDAETHEFAREVDAVFGEAPRE